MSEIDKRVINAIGVIAALATGAKLGRSESEEYSANPSKSIFQFRVCLALVHMLEDNDCIFQSADEEFGNH